MIRFLLVGSALALPVLLLASSGAGLRASRRLLFIGIVVLFCAAALRPDIVNSLANHVGVGRGADLVLYIVATGFLYGVVATYQQFKEQERRMAVLVRRIALLEQRGHPNAELDRAV